MPRRRKTSAAEGFTELIARMPWWVGVALAVVFYVWLHNVATQPVVAPTPSQPISGLLLGAWGRGLATAGQYVLPLLCLAGAGISAWRRRHRRQLVADVAQSPAADVLEGMTWREFEMLVGEGFRQQGYQVEETGGGGADGGVDLVLSRPSTTGREKVLVQCKQWRAFKVGVDVVRELYGVMAARGAAAGVVVTSGRFTDEAVAFAKGRNVRLVDGSALHQLIRAAKAQAPRPSETPFASRPFNADTQPSTPPACPVCSKSMVRRTAKRGANAGSEFWGCTGYPACRGTRPIA